MGKVFLSLIITAVFAFALNPSKASEEEFMAIKGIGAKKAEAIIKYRKKNKITKAEDLKNIKGIGDSIIYNVKNDVKNGTKSKKKSKKTTEKESSTKK